MGLGLVACAPPNGAVSEISNEGLDAQEPGFQATPDVVERLYVRSAPIEESSPNLYFQLVDETPNTQSIQLQFNQKEGVAGPRAMEVFVTYPSSLVYDRVDSLPAVARADKNIVVQEKEEGKLRIIIFSAQNVNRVTSGGLLTLHFKKLSNQAGQIAFVKELPVFAPVDTNEGLLFGEPVQVGW